MATKKSKRRVSSKRVYNRSRKDLGEAWNVYSERLADVTLDLFREVNTLDNGVFIQFSNKNVSRKELLEEARAIVDDLEDRLQSVLGYVEELQNLKQEIEDDFLHTMNDLVSRDRFED